MDQEPSTSSNIIQQQQDVKKFNQQYAQKLSLNDSPQHEKNAQNAATPPLHIINSHLYTILDDNYASQIYEFNKMTFTLENWQAIKNALNSQDIVQKMYGLIGIRKLLSIQYNPPIQYFIEAGLIPQLVQYAKQTQFLQLQFEALWSLTNIASGNSQQVDAIVCNGGVQLFIDSLSSPSLAIAEQAVWALGNLAGDNATLRNNLINHKVIPKLVQLISQNQNNASMIRNGVWTLCNLCRGTPKPKYNLIREAIHFCCKILIGKFIDDKLILTDLLWALSYADGLKDDIETEVADKLIANVCLYLSSPYTEIIVPSLRILGNLFQNQSLTDFFIKNKYINMLLVLLNNIKKSIRKETCFLIGRLTDVPNYSVIYIFYAKFEEVFSNPNVVPKLLDIFSQDTYDVKVQIGHIFANLSCHDNIKEVYQFYIQADILKYYGQMLKSDNTKPVVQSLKCMKKILDVGQKCLQNHQNMLVKKMEETGLTETVEKLQYHPSEQVYSLVFSIIQEYFFCEGDIQQGNNDSLQPNSAAAPSPFGAPLGLSFGSSPFGPYGHFQF